MNRYQRELTFGRDTWNTVEKYSYKRIIKRRKLRRMLGVLLCKLHISLGFIQGLRFIYHQKKYYLLTGKFNYNVDNRRKFNRIALIPYVENYSEIPSKELGSYKRSSIRMPSDDSLLYEPCYLWNGLQWDLNIFYNHLLK